MRTLLVTGGAGFIGSNFIRFALTGPARGWAVLNLDKLTYAGNPENLEGIDRRFPDRYTFVRGDIADRALVGRVFAEHHPDWVVNFAAESHVDRSIVGPSVFVRTNVVGTSCLLEAAREAWPPSHWHANRFLQVSTDEVYGSLPEDDRSVKFTEQTSLAPHSPYSASKAAADLLALSYHHTYGFPTLVTRCSNNYGPYQFPEKLIPLMIHNALSDKPLPVYGDGRNVRDWLHVGDHCDALWLVLSKGEPGQVYNIGGNNEMQNIEIVKMLLDCLGKPHSLITFVKDRPGHDRRYAMDAAKMRHRLGWEPAHRFEEKIRDTVEWYLAHRDWVEHVVSGQYQQYYEMMYGDR